MYDPSDPRSRMAASAAAPKAAAPQAFAGADYGLFYEIAPQVVGDGAKTWLTRGQNFLVAQSEVDAGGSLQRSGQADEYVLLLPDRDTPALIEANGERVDVDGFSLVILPPGDSGITLPKGGRATRIFSTGSDDLNALCSNAESYAEPHPNVALLEPWPDPIGGFRIRAYSLDVPPTPGRFGRIFRCTTLMVNYLDPQHGPRDITKLSPHHHDDFEQGSLALDGAFTHHLRWPWTTNLNVWRDDEHALVQSPSLTVIPPPAIHTSRGMEPGLNQLVDIFSPPRVDFAKQGWVLNADEYPMPSHLAD
ncbi:hypothetical protein [Mesorhizobium australicum]|uniref:5-deoxy-glucuronate isomerase n=1 Tax=Mesorhizobium australicum TaxID=536018 RepID=A0A1X7PLD5_9HYPH|nr:hypothetical protein [Mesorhizobium australicum]SMH52621.1 hypothetical protein SAMN02982922_4705 [Mesorhizobium australicum]